MPQDTLVTPPIRQSVEDANSAAANGIAQPMTEKSWYLFWDRLGKMANRQNWMVNVGTHADRPPAANMPNGAIYVEFDRGAIYQNWSGAWQYLAGTMYGTFAPDQRPTDLGSHDAGFDFRTTDQPPREFIWSGAAWVEVTAATVGTHANRPAAATEAEGNLYVEYDRGGVIYQNWVGGWQYLAGTMWGTLVPDQRPTDLGTRDAGFDFRTTSAPPREFIWSGTAWIETTPQANQVQYVAASSSLTLSTVAQDVPGAVLTLSQSGRYSIQGVFDFLLQGTGDIGSTFAGWLNAGGSVLPQHATFSGQYVSGTSGNRATAAQQWYSTLTSGTVVKLQALKDGGTGSSQAVAPNTTLSAIFIGP